MIPPLPPIIDFDSVDSTNRALADMVREDCDLPAWTTVSAEEQTAGRGRLDHRWQSPSGLNIACSILLRPTAPIENLGTLPLLVGLAVIRAVSRIDRKTGDRLHLKWPNDIWCDGRKLCGILCEIPTDYPSPRDGATPLIAGIGINVNTTPADLPPDLRQTATSLFIVSHHEWDRRNLLELLREELINLYSSWARIGVCPHLSESENRGLSPSSAPQKSGSVPIPDTSKIGVCPYSRHLKNRGLSPSGIWGLSPFIDELRERDLLLGKEISVEMGREIESGVAAGIDENGALLLRKADGDITHVFAGDVHILM